MLLGLILFKHNKLNVCIYKRLSFIKAKADKKTIEVKAIALLGDKAKF